MSTNGDTVGPSPLAITFDSEADAAYVRLARFAAGEAVVQVLVGEVPNQAEIVLDFSDDGRLLGIEVIGASAVLAPELLTWAVPPATPPGEDGGEARIPNT